MDNISSYYGTDRQDRIERPERDFPAIIPEKPETTNRDISPDELDSLPLPEDI